MGDAINAATGRHLSGRPSQPGQAQQAWDQANPEYYKTGAGAYFGPSSGQTPATASSDAYRPGQAQSQQSPYAVSTPYGGGSQSFAAYTPQTRNAGMSPQQRGVAATAWTMPKQDLLQWGQSLPQTFAAYRPQFGMDPSQAWSRNAAIVQQINDTQARQQVGTYLGEGAPPADWGQTNYSPQQMISNANQMVSQGWRNPFSVTQSQTLDPARLAGQSAQAQYSPDPSSNAASRPATSRPSATLPGTGAADSRRAASAERAAAARERAMQATIDSQTTRDRQTVERLEASNDPRAAGARSQLDRKIATLRSSMERNQSSEAARRQEWAANRDSELDRNRREVDDTQKMMGYFAATGQRDQYEESQKLLRAAEENRREIGNAAYTSSSERQAADRAQKEDFLARYRDSQERNRAELARNPGRDAKAMFLENYTSTMPGRGDYAVATSGAGFTDWQQSQARAAWDRLTPSQRRHWELQSSQRAQSQGIATEPMRPLPPAQQREVVKYRQQLAAADRNRTAQATRNKQEMQSFYARNPNYRPGGAFG